MKQLSSAKVVVGCRQNESVIAEDGDGLRALVLLGFFDNFSV